MLKPRGWSESGTFTKAIGQTFECVILFYHVHGTYNTTQMATVIKNALLSIAALLYTANSGNTNENPGLAVKFSTLKHIHRYKGGLIDDRSPLFPRIPRADLEELD